MKKNWKIILIAFLMIGFSAFAIATKWSDYGAISTSEIADGDDFLMRDVSDTTLGPLGTQKRYAWSSLKTDLATAGFAEEDTAVSFTSVETAASATPGFTAKDSGCPDTDKEIGKLYWNYVSGAAGAENGDFYLQVMEGGNETTYLQGDVTNTRLTSFKDFNLASGKVYKIDGTNLSATSETLTNKTIDADDNTIQDMPYDIAWSLVDPADADIHYVRLQRAVTASSIGCIVDPEGTGESVVLDIQECDSNGDSCASILSSTITCANTPTAGTISDSALAANAFLKIDIGTVTGTVKTLSIYGIGKESY